MLSAANRIGIDAQQGQQAGGGRADAVAQGVGVLQQGRGGAANDLSTVSGMPALLPGV